MNKTQNKPIHLTDLMLQGDLLAETVQVTSRKTEIFIHDKEASKFYRIDGKTARLLIEKLMVDQELFDEICEEL